MSELTAPTASSVEANCPRCQGVIIDPQGLGWCRACGYCRSLEDERAQQLLASTASKPAGPSMGAVIGNVPIWSWLLLAGLVAVIVGSLAVDRYLPAGKNFPRAFWATAQIAGGLLICFACQLYALIQVAADDEKLGFKDAIMPTRLWSVVCKRLPRTAPSLLGGVWGLALVVCSFLFIGGLGHWYSYLPGVKDRPHSSAQR